MGWHNGPQLLSIVTKKCSGNTTKHFDKRMFGFQKNCNNFISAKSNDHI